MTSFRLLTSIFVAVVLIAAFNFLPQEESHAEPVVTTNLYAGWNIFTYFGPNQPVADALSEIDGKYSIVYELEADAQNWISYDPSVPFLSDLESLQKFSAYMILMSDGGSVTFDAGSLPSNPLPVLYEGWNLVGYTGATGDVGDALNSIQGQYSVVYSLHAELQSWLSYGPGAPFLSDLQSLHQFGAYLIRVTEAGNGGEAGIIETVPASLPLVADEFATTAQNLADAVAELNNSELKFIQDGRAGEDGSVLDGELRTIAANAMAVGQMATDLGFSMVNQEDTDVALQQGELYYATARVGLFAGHRGP